MNSVFYMYIIHIYIHIRDYIHTHCIIQYVSHRMYTPSFSICAGQLGTRPGWWIWSWWMPQWKRCWRRRTRSQMADWLELGYQRTLWAYNGLNSVCVFFLNLSMIYVLIWFGIHLFGYWIKIHQTCVYIYMYKYIYIHGTYLLYIYMPPICTYIVPSVSARQDLLDLPQRDLAEAAEAGSWVSCGSQGQSWGFNPQIQTIYHLVIEHSHGIDGP
jgi:hypothetical protein